MLFVINLRNRTKAAVIFVNKLDAWRYPEGSGESGAEAGAYHRGAGASICADFKSQQRS